MIHFDEMACLLYLEGQLEPQRAQELEAHVDECASCRNLLNALQSETTLLSAALTEDNEPIPARLLGERTRRFCCDRVLGLGGWASAFIRSVEQCRLWRHGSFHHDRFQRRFLGRME
jgi:predicted anti-sigma-YlaC factor YlaD